MKAKKRMFWALVVMVAMLLLMPVIAMATAPSPTVTVSQTPSPTPSPTPDPNTTPAVSFDPSFTMPPEGEFFGDDGRTEIADYDNPAFTADTEDDPTMVFEEGALTSYLDELFKDNSQTMDLVVLLTLLGLIPTIVLMMTGFTRILIVLSFTRNAIGTNNMPPNQVLIGIALLITLFVMFPVFSDINETALTPYNNGEITFTEAIDKAQVPLREFMLSQTYSEDLDMFIGYADLGDVENYEDVPTHVLIPAFVTSEIKYAFLVGFCIYLPFIAIDMIVASTLMSMGMMMLPPVMISLPFKVLLFVSVDGWNLIISTLIQGFR